MTADETHPAIEATFRIERARLIAGLTRLVRNIDLAEELAQDALVVALAEWPRTGVPANPRKPPVRSRPGAATFIALEISPIAFKPRRPSA